MSPLRLVHLFIMTLFATALALPTSTLAQDSLTVDLTVTSVTVNQLGVVTITGTVTCSEPTFFTELFVRVEQPVGRFRTIAGETVQSLGPCEGVLPFSVQVTADEGRFGPGIAYIFVGTFGCTPDFTSCNGDSENLALRIRRG